MQRALTFDLLLLPSDVAAEGLDFRQCQLVACFDMPCNVRHLQQCKGRARKPNSIFAVMMEEHMIPGSIPLATMRQAAGMKNAFSHLRLHLLVSRWNLHSLLQASRPIAGPPPRMFQLRMH